MLTSMQAEIITSNQHCTGWKALSIMHMLTAIDKQLTVQGDDD